MYLGLMHIQFNVSDSKGKRLKASRRRWWQAGIERRARSVSITYALWKILKEKKIVDNAKMLKVFFGNSLYALVVHAILIQFELFLFKIKNVKKWKRIINLMILKEFLKFNFRISRFSNFNFKKMMQQSLYVWLLLQIN